MIHVYSHIEATNELRWGQLARAKQTWDRLGLRSIAYRDFDPQFRVPKIKEMIERGLREDDRVLLTNADSYLVRDTIDIVGEKDMCWSYRINFYKELRHWITSSEALLRGTLFHGVDAVVVGKWWWEIHKAGIPDVLVGREGWDWIFRFVMGEKAQIPRIVCHEYHDIPYWQQNRGTDIGQLWNFKQIIGWWNALGEIEREEVRLKWPAIDEYRGISKMKDAWGPEIRRT